VEDRAEVPVAAAATASALIRPEASYLITGGLGGLGLGVAEWMVEQGARHLVLVGRSGASETSQQAIDRMRAFGAQVQVARVDVSDSDSLRQLIEGLRPPLAGVIHAAGVLEDSTLLKLDSARLHRVLAPKVAGAWNLHTLTRAAQLDFFVLYSSGSGILGTPGQAAYAAGNAFLDALAQHRRSQGLPASSIAWGPFSEAGMVAGAVASQRLANRGIGALTPAQGLAFLDRLLAGCPAYVAVLPLNLRQWREMNPRSANLPFFAELIASGEPAKARASDHRLRDALLAADPKGRVALLEQHVREQVAAVLRSSPDRIGPRVPFNTLGMDSLMGLELRNRLEDSLGLRLPATLVWQHPAVASLSAYLMELLYLPTPPEPDPQSPSPVSTLDRIAELSDEEVDRLLAEKIAE
jgi:NAD(P)-dependent dehydrogenase (short-subunit alcohol dehydrogenase family)/acyl carrier protein